MTTTINAQTPGPVRVGLGHSLFVPASPDNPDGMIAAIRYLGGSKVNLAETQANAHLLAASFNAFDRAGRALGVDATNLATHIDIAVLIATLRLYAETSLSPALARNALASLNVHALEIK